MKPIIFALAVLLVVGCRQSTSEDFPVNKQEPLITELKESVTMDAFGQRQPAVCNPDAYVVTLEGKTVVDGGWEWTWSVYNHSPGNGNNGTAQDLSHWGMNLGACIPFSSVTAAAYSADGVTWTSFIPSYQLDPSQNCMNLPVIKFDYGTTGPYKSYYRLTLNQDYPQGWVPAYYKSGANTGCCIFNFNGIGCPGGGGTDE